MQRHLPALLLILLCALPAAAEERPPIRFGLTAVILTDRLHTLDTWSQYLGEALDRPVRFVQRRSYHEITRGLLSGELDFAWVCGYPFVVHRNRMQLVTVPLNGGEPLYQSYLIVPAEDTATETFADLAGTVFAYSDPDSNSGYLAPNHRMLNALRAATPDGRVACRLQREPDTLLIRVDNTGPPLEPELRRHLFEPFVSRDGTGLGLWMCYQIATQLGGSIQAGNRDDGVFFEVRLPLESAA